MIDQTHIFLARWDRGGPSAQADAGLIKQALLGAGGQQHQYSPEGGRILLSVRADSSAARMSVQDEARASRRGRPAPHLRPLLPHRQIRARQTGGTGLGLAIAKWIADRHGGWFESSPGRRWAPPHHHGAPLRQTGPGQDPG